ncbi:amidase, partial [Paraburkholderia sp. SIMBA_055]
NRNWTLLGCRSVNVPCLTSARGAPICVQVIGRPVDDARCRAAAGFVERSISESAGIKGSQRAAV